MDRMEVERDTGFPFSQRWSKGTPQARLQASEWAEGALDTLAAPTPVQVGISHCAACSLQSLLSGGNADIWQHAVRSTGALDCLRSWGGPGCGVQEAAEAFNKRVA